MIKEDISYFQFFHEGINVLLPKVFWYFLLKNTQLLNLQKKRVCDDPLPNLHTVAYNCLFVTAFEQLFFLLSSKRPQLDREEVVVVCCESICVSGLSVQEDTD